MERSQCNSLQNFDSTKTDFLKKRLLKSVNSSVVCLSPQNSIQQNASLHAIRTSMPNSMLVSSVQQPQNSIAVSHNLVTHSISPMKIQTNNSAYPLQLHLGSAVGSLSTVNVPVQIPGPSSNISVPVQLSGPTVSLPLQISATTTNVPVQLPAGGTINVPLQLPGGSQNIQLSSPVMSSMPFLQSANSQSALHSSIIHLHVGPNQSRNTINTTVDNNSELSCVNSSSMQFSDPSTTVQMKMSNNIAGIPSVQVNSSPVHLQIPNSAPNASIHLQLPNAANTGAVQLRNNPRGVPHVVYIQTPAGLKPVTSTEVINTASSSGNPPQIIVRRPVTSTAGIQFVSNVSTKSHIASKAQMQSKTSVLAPANSTQPIVIQKPKPNATMVPVSLASGSAGKQTFAYLGTVKKPNINKSTENQSILIPNSQINSNLNPNANQKLFLAPMNVPKIPNTKFILPVTMASKGPIINLQIANGQLQNDPQGNITVMRDHVVDGSEVPPLQPLGKGVNPSNGKDCSTSSPSTVVPQSPKADKTFTISIPGSRAESTGEQEYTLSIPETNASMNDDVYTVSIEDEEGGSSREKSFTLSIPEKGKSLLNKVIHDRHENMSIPAPAILRRSNSEHNEKKSSNINIKRRISLCHENLMNKSQKFEVLPQQNTEKCQEQNDSDNNDDHRVPSLFCDEKFDKDLETKVHPGEQEDEYKDNTYSRETSNKVQKSSESLLDYYSRDDNEYSTKDLTPRIKRESSSSTTEEDPPGLIWNNGTAILQGSDLQFQTNEFGLIDVMENSEREQTILFNVSSKYHTPLKQRIDRSGREKKPTSPEDLYCCDGCGCHGMAAEFVTPNFCSLTCQSEVQKATQKKKEREKTELTKKRNRVKKLLMQKQRLDTDQQSEVKLYDSIPGDTSARLSDSSLVKTNDDTVENEKYPWMCGKNGFSWMRYLEFCKAKAAPAKLFKDPFPYNRNGFKVGMKLEAIDPMHPSVFSVVTVAEVQGYRLRLHFDDYPDTYDFWVNADSIDIFPPGWCEKNGRSLKPPQGFSLTNFSWALYLKQTKSIAAPRHLFPHMCTTMVRPNGFRTGMKLEAEDRKNNLICVATVADMLDNRILINFDSWDEMYDYWVDPTSPYIHPVGWAEENGVSLTPPNFYKDPDTFLWDSYLSETGSTPVPARAFKTRPPQGFKIGMKMEVVDRRVPFLIRVASVSEVKAHQVRVSFDGWPEELSCWLDDDSPDIHPVGWCLKTGHPLEPPLTAEEALVEGACGVGGCRGLGSLRGGAHKTHGPAACPYRARSPPAPPDRLAPAAPACAPATHLLPKTRKALLPGRGRPKETSETPPSDAPKEKLPRGRPPKHKRVEEVSKNETVVEQPASDEESVASSAPSKRWRQSVVEESVASGYEARAGSRALGPALALAPLLRRLSLPGDPRLWSQGEVQDFVQRAVPPAGAARLAEQRVAGSDLLMMSQEEMVELLGLKLGPAIKLYNAVLQLRTRLLS